MYVSTQIKQAVENDWTDQDLNDRVDFFGHQQTKAGVLRFLISHQIHHRGQMTVLMRQADLRVPGIYGPTREDQEA